MAHSLSLLLFPLLAMAILQTMTAVEFDVDNQAASSPGGARFLEEIGEDYARETMVATTNFIWNMFEEVKDEDKKKIDRVLMVIKDYDGAEAITYGEDIIVSSRYLQGYEGNITWEFTSLIYHEMTHVWQWDGAGGAPNGLVEGVADYTVLTSGYAPLGFAKPGMGDQWDQGYDFTARFLEYCDGLQPGFVAALNRKMREEYKAEYFVELTGKPVEELWSEYKAYWGGEKKNGGKGLDGDGGRRVRRRRGHRGKHGRKVGNGTQDNA